ncbi:MAG: AAA family ATPase, partial [Verrucomicrobiota bacterium]
TLAAMLIHVPEPASYALVLAALEAACSRAAARPERPRVRLNRPPRRAVFFGIRAERLAAPSRPAMDRAKADAAQLPVSYEASKFVSRCSAAAAANLERHLGELCLDPATALVDGSPWYFPALISTLREYQTEWIEQRRAAVVVTAIGQQVYDALEYARETRRMVLIDGNARIGKTFAVKAWCEQNPGRARYVQVPSTNDELGFFRAIASALGMSCGGSWKAVQLRSRIEDVLQTGQITLVFDEAHYAFPSSSCRTTIPGRINWIMTALINYGVGVALVTTPQFIKTQKVIEQRTSWTSEQLTGRIGHYEKLADTLSDADLKAVAKSLLPTGDARCIEALVLYAKSSAKYLAGIETAVARAKFIASRNQRAQVTFADVKQTIENVIPSDRALADALNVSATPRRGRAANASARPLQPQFSAPAKPPQPVATLRQTTPGETNRLAGLETAPG